MKTKILIITAIILILYITAGCKEGILKDNDNEEEPQNVIDNSGDEEESKVDDEKDPQNVLIGSKWKLAGLFDVQTGVLRELKPSNCERCYTFSFESDSSFHTFSNSYDIYGIYKIDENNLNVYICSEIVATFHADETVFINALNEVNSFSQQDNKLFMYYNDKNNYLVFETYNTENYDLISFNMLKMGDFNPELLISEWDWKLVELAYTADGIIILPVEFEFYDNEGNKIVGSNIYFPQISIYPLNKELFKNHLPVSLFNYYEQEIGLRICWFSIYFMYFSVKDNLMNVPLIFQSILTTPAKEMEFLSNCIKNAYSFVINGDELFIHFIGDDNINVMIFKKVDHE